MFKLYVKLIILVFITIPLCYNSQRNPKNKSNISEADIEKTLLVHNNARKDLNIDSLKWSVKLANQAQLYANNLARRNGGLVHSTSNSHGENLYMVYSFGNQNDIEIPDFPGFDASQAWYDEIKFYRYSKIKRYRIGPAVGHYTQMIWESTKEVGIGWAVSRSGKVYVVARYYPAGNVIREYPY